MRIPNILKLSWKIKGEHPLNLYPFDFIQADLVAGAVVELGGARGLVGGDRLGVLQGAAGLQVIDDAGGAEGVVVDAAAEARSPSTRRLIIRSTSLRFMGRSVSRLVLPGVDRKSGPFLSPAIPVG